MKEKLIVNGGDSLKDCPKDWEEAKIIQDELNNGNEDSVLKWKFDCGFKLDYDGAIISVESRFYPPKKHYGMTWDGTATISLFGKEILRQKFDCKTLDELKTKVEKFTKEFSEKLEKVISDL